MLATCPRIISFPTSNKIKSYSNFGRKKKNRSGTLKCLILSIEKGTKIAQAIAPELVPLNGHEDVVLRQILDSSRTGGLLVSAQLTVKLPLLTRGRGRGALGAFSLLCWFGLIIYESSADLL